MHCLHGSNVNFCSGVMSYVLCSGLMPPVDYAVLTEWFDWIEGNTNVDVDLFGECL